MSDKITDDTNPQGASAIIEFAKDFTQPHIETFKDPEGITPDVVAIIGRDQDGATSTAVLGFARDAYRKRPLRRKGTIATTTLDSFIALTNRQSGEQSVIFADNGERPSLTAVINFHAPEADGLPEFCDDRVSYAFPLSTEWTAWKGKDGKQMGQQEFAEWVEDRLFDIGEPGSAGEISQAFAAAASVTLAGPQTMLGLSKGLAIRVEERVAKSVNLQSGEGMLEFSVEHQDAATGAPLKVPAAFHIRIPILRGGPTYSIPVRLRYRVGGGKVSWFFQMHRPELFMLDAVDASIARVALDSDMTKPPADIGCGLPVYMGTPPA